jgi:hypothetical protein
MLASTLKLRPRYFLIVLALAGDSTITRLVLPRVTGPLLVEARVEEARVVLDAVLLAVPFAALFFVVPVVFFVVAIS